MGKATDLVNNLEARGPRSLPLRPELKIRDDAPSIVVTSDTSVEEVLGNMPGAQVVLRTGDRTVQAVVLSPERYAQMAGSEITASDFEATLEGKIQPQAEVLGRLMVEQVDQTQEWPLGKSRTQS